MTEHAHHEQVVVATPRLPQRETIIRVQRQKLADYDDRHTALCALVEDVQNDHAQLAKMLSQVITENRVLRKRLGLGESDPIELTDEEAAAAEGGGAKTVETPDDATPEDAARAIAEAGDQPPPDGQ